MKKFFIKLAAAVGCLGLVLTPFIYSNQVAERRLLNNIQPFGDSITVLALGDSHVECSLDPEYFPEMVNRANSAEVLLYTLSKLNFYKQLNPNIKTLILSYNYFLMGDWRSRETHGSLTSVMYPKYISLLKSQPKLLSKLKGNYLSGDFILNYTSVPTKSIFDFYQMGRGISAKMEFEGGFISEFVSDIDKADLYKKSEGHYGSFDPKKPYSYIGRYQLQLFTEIMDYCKNNNIKVILFNAPTHKMYNDLIPKAIINSVDSIANDACENYGAKYINMYDYHLPDSMYRDYDHINTEGAKVITPMLRDSLIKLGIL